jgi:hypothetical protein
VTTTRYQLFCLGFIALLMGMSPNLRGTERIPNEHKISGFAVGCQAWSFNHFTVFEAIEMTAKAGGRTIEFYPGQKLAPDLADVKFDHNSPDDVIGKVKAKLKQHDILAVNFGVVTPPARLTGRPRTKPVSGCSPATTMSGCFEAIPVIVAGEHWRL